MSHIPLAATRPDDRLPSVFRFLTELVAWVATPWALARESILLAVVATVVLIGLPTVFSTPGDKHHVPVAVPGLASAAILILHLAAAVTAAWFAWPIWAAVTVTVLTAITLVTEQAHLRWLIRQPGRADADNAGGATQRP